MQEFAVGSVQHAAGVLPVATCMYHMPQPVLSDCALVTVKCVCWVRVA